MCFVLTSVLCEWFIVFRLSCWTLVQCLTPCVIRSVGDGEESLFPLLLSDQYRDHKAHGIKRCSRNKVFVCQTRWDRLPFRKHIEHWTRRFKAGKCFEIGLLLSNPHTIIMMAGTTYNLLLLMGPWYINQTTYSGLFERKQVLGCLANIQSPRCDTVDS